MCGALRAEGIKVKIGVGTRVLSGWAGGRAGGWVGGRGWEERVGASALPPRRAVLYRNLSWSYILNTWLAKSVTSNITTTTAEQISR